MDKTNPENSSPSFFKILLDDSASNLRLPPAFVKKLCLEGIFPENPVLKIQTGRKWRVKIERSGERACFGKGWLDFVKDTKIKFGDFLVFRLVANSKFKVYIFDPNGCLKDLSSASKSCSRNGSRITDTDLKNTTRIEEEDEDDADHEVDVKKDIELQQSKGKKKSVKPCFQKVLTGFNAYSVDLPSQFLLGSGLRKADKIILRNKIGREWPVTIKKWTHNYSHRVYISHGWADFRRENKLMEGDTCLFQYFHGDQEASQNGFIQVDVVKKAARKSEKPLWNQVTRKRGRPPPIRPGKRFRISDTDLKNTIKIEEEDDDDEVDGKKVNELQPVKGKKKSVKPCFRKVLTGFNAYNVDFPSQFLLESGLRKAGNIILRNKSGREWPVTIKKCTQRHSHRIYISHGWADFRRENKLMEGDTCSFQYFHGDETSQNGFIQVEVVQKAAKKSEKPLWNQVTRKRGRPPQIRPDKRFRISDTDLKNAIEIDDDDEVDGEKVIEFQPVKGKKKSVKSCFRKVLTGFNAYSVILPSQFLLESGLTKEAKVILRNKSGKEWPVTIKTFNQGSRHNRVYISHGWADFRRANKLMEGDTCSFQYFHGGQIGFIQVEVVKKAAKESEKPTWNQAARKSGRPPLRLGKRSRISDTDLKNTIKIEEEDDDDAVDGEKDIELQPAKRKKKFVKPRFRKVLMSFNAYSVDLPSQFLRDSGLRKADKVILRNKSGREWPVMITTNRRNRVFISHGWADFRRVNNLMEGDTCSFQYFHGDNEASQSGFIQVKVVKKAARKSGRDPCIQAPRKKGRPPQIRRGKR